MLQCCLDYFLFSVSRSKPTIFLLLSTLWDTSYLLLCIMQLEYLRTQLLTSLSMCSSYTLVRLPGFHSNSLESDSSVANLQRRKDGIKYLRILIMRKNFFSSQHKHSPIIYRVAKNESIHKRRIFN